MYLNRIALSAVALFLIFPAAGVIAAAQGPPSPGYGWDAPPQELNEIQRQGFHEGLEAARNDFRMNRHPDVADHEIFRHPHLPPQQREAFQDGFRRGYDRAMSHLMHDGQPGFRQQAPTPPPPQWDAFPTEFNDLQRRGFHDGMEGARRDYENHRQPDVNNRDEYRHPHLPPEAREAYREGFRRGYDRATTHLMGQPFRY
ncbi:MAG TPA: hypothetical protein VK764_00165 [Terracidiphilus sp.]|jgi:hypothetical protein|nr:hypothetical protein [Terracidiphilus sp.]